MRAVVVSGPGDYAVTDIADPVPAHDEVLLRVESMGICGTDLHILDGQYIAQYPIVPGHEFAGRIVAVGDQVTGWTVGDGVTADPNIYCGTCDRCRHGLENLCRNAQAVGVTRDGAAAELVVVPAANCVAVDDQHLTDASLVEPLSCAVHGWDVVGSRLAASVLIYGAGPMGLMLSALSRAAGAGHVALVDPNQDRLQRADRVGASEWVPSGGDLATGRDYEVVIDCSGAPAAIEDGLERVAPGGVFLQFGVAKPGTRVRVSPERILMDEITITGSRAVKRSFERAALLYSRGVLDPADFVTHTFALEDFAQAVQVCRSGAGVKVQLRP
jgi:2-desacetyl-2-hydroxyethyl bacteriochlorophyllide A dehydrogenase